MKKTLLAMLLVAVVVLVGKLLFFPMRQVKASSQEIFGACVADIPQEWGDFVGGSEQTGLAFRDRQGTLRFVTNIPCNGTIPPVALQVRRTVAR